MTVPASLAGAWLTVDLDAIAENWRQLGERAPGAICAAVVKADGYGTGAAEVAKRLYREGCRSFFVAHPSEGLAIRPLLPEATVYILNGLVPGAAGDYAAAGVTPVLNTGAQALEWAEWCAAGDAVPAALHVDTGMTRLGLAPAEASTLAEETEALRAIPDLLVMSHFACAEDPDHPLNRQQVEAFEHVRRAWPGRPASMANSSGIFLGPDAHHDLLRPGVALYGANPQPGRKNPMRPAVRLTARILQLQTLQERRTVGYGATATAPPGTKLATIAAGYADGLWRALSSRGTFHIGGHRVPIIGRVSMDLISVDVTAVPDGLLTPDAEVVLLDDSFTVDDLAAQADTIGYEVLTALGRRYHRTYLGSDAA